MIRCKLKELMAKQNKLDVRQIAKETEIPKETLMNLIDNQWHQVRREYLDSLCRYFECSVGELLEYQESVNGILPA